MADEQKPAGPVPPSPDQGESADKLAQPAAQPAKPAAPKAPAAHAAAPKAPPVMAVTPWEGELVQQLRERFGDRIREYSSYLGQNFLIAQPEALIPILEFLKLEADFDYLVDITAVDHPSRAERFDIVYILYSFSRNERIRIKVMIPDGARPASAIPVHLAANWLEREVFDMFGIEFEGHPNMRRILLPEEWEGYPLRKDYSILEQDNKWVKENLGIESGQ
ncbi:MAG TPA: NADH-quinone oxidoreductase subunit C [Bryobacteraceae bacterium]|jgi:NADH-quinone oxidoreductase subunit C|nr:NADH-quinone oxidoreductase subunit C [Bryobacteraceae bacterium]